MMVEVSTFELMRAGVFSVLLGRLEVGHVVLLLVFRCDVVVDEIVLSW